MKKSTIEKRTKKHLEELYNMDDRLADIKAKMSLDQPISKKPTEITFKKQKFLIATILLGILLIGTSSVTTYALTKKNNDSSHIQIAPAEEYMQEAITYLAETLDTYEDTPVSSFYISKTYILNIYRGSQFKTNEPKTCYVYQIYGLTDIYDSKITLQFQNKEQDQKIVEKQSYEKSVIGLINDETFAIQQKYLLATIYINGKYYDTIQLIL